jgi:U3 small nucleolar ribonucleoprotein component
MTGTINADETAAPELFILLPMAGAEGAETVKNKIFKTASEGTFERAGRKAAAEVKISVTMPMENTRDLKSYLSMAKRNHLKIS